MLRDAEHQPSHLCSSEIVVFQPSLLNFDLALPECWKSCIAHGDGAQERPGCCVTVFEVSRLSRVGGVVWVLGCFVFFGWSKAPWGKVKGARCVLTFVKGHQRSFLSHYALVDVCQIHLLNARTFCDVRCRSVADEERVSFAGVSAESVFFWGGEIQHQQDCDQARHSPLSSASVDANERASTG